MNVGERGRNIVEYFHFPNQHGARPDDKPRRNESHRPKSAAALCPGYPPPKLFVTTINAGRCTGLLQRTVAAVV